MSRDVLIEYDALTTENDRIEKIHHFYTTKGPESSPVQKTIVFGIGEDTGTGA